MESALLDDIRKAVAEAIETGGVLHVAPVARRLAARHEQAGASPRRVADLLLRAGIYAAVPLALEKI